jgi:imidazolonepropionase-like amidohydrolase
MIDGTGGPPLEQAAILLDGSTIRSVGTQESVVPPEGAPVEEFVYEDKTVLPGLIDCHVHLNGIGDGRSGDDLALLPDEVLAIQSAQNARTHLYSGVTSVRDCGAKNRTTFTLRSAIDMGITPGPRLVLSGRPVAIVGGHLSYFGTEATGPDECRAAVRQLMKEGADFIKVTATGGSTRTSSPSLPSFTVDELKAICDETHKFGKHVSAHCTASQGMVNALEAGVDTIFHAGFRNPDDTYVFRSEIADRIAEQGVFVNPTLLASRSRISALREKLESERLAEAEQMELDLLSSQDETRLECFTGMLRAGVTMACGSDSAWSYYKMGGFQYEIEALVAAGMSPMEGIVSATLDSARSCRIDGEVGSLEPGKQGDLLVVDGDPSQDIAALRNVADVFLNGDLIDRGNYI